MERQTKKQAIKEATMKLSRILYNAVEMFLFVVASIYVTNEYIRSGNDLTMFFGLFLILIFINQIMKTAKHDANQKSSEVKK